ncbi:helix-turn-helix domain-containing protein [Bacillus sp. DX4.1]|uniref:helix-turn-helix domain-containing protein n=1 Tax=Bacillus sp. DX4.1 TaxID=3055867 RepID=UPI0033903C4B
MSDNRDRVVNLNSRKYVNIDYGVLHDTKVFRKVYEKIVYVILCKYADYETKTSYPSVSRIAKECMCSENTVRTAIRKLEELRLVKVEKRVRDDGKGQTSNLYTLLPIPEEFPKLYRPSMLIED